MKILLLLVQQAKGPPFAKPTHVFHNADTILCQLGGKKGGIRPCAQGA
jgi:hypothetical protein